MSDRTPYQRGHRDSLMDAAARMDRNADAYKADEYRYSKSDHPLAERVRADSRRGAAIYRNAAAELRRMAEAMPEDPEAGNV